MGIAYNPFLDSETGGAHRNHEVAELLKFWTERIMEIETVEKEGPSLGLMLEKTPEVVSIPRSNKRVEVNMGHGNGLLITNLGVVWKLLRPSWCPHPHASLIEETTERVRLAPTDDEYLAKLSVLHKLISPQTQESGEKTSKLGQQRRWSRVAVWIRRVGTESTPAMDGHVSGYCPFKKKTWSLGLKTSRKGRKVKCK